MKLELWLLIISPPFSEFEFSLNPLFTCLSFGTKLELPEDSPITKGRLKHTVNLIIALLTSHGHVTVIFLLEG